MGESGGGGEVFARAGGEEDEFALGRGFSLFLRFLVVVVGGGGGYGMGWVLLALGVAVGRNEYLVVE